MSNANDFIIENGVLKAYIGSAATVRIPDGVTEIGDGVFARKFNLSTVIFPDSIVVIGKGAFRDCQLLNRVDLPKGLKILGDSCFYGCRLSRVSFPHGLEQIGEYAFLSNKGLQDAVLPDTVAKIGAHAFNMTSLNAVHIPAALTEISNGAFRNIIHLHSLTIPGSVKTIGEEAFAYSYALKSVTVEPGVERLEAGCFRSTGIQVLHLPESVKEIGENAFHSCDRLQEFSAPGVPVSSLPGSEVKALAMVDFFTHPERYTEAGVVASFHKYLFIQKKKWLPVIFREDNVKLLTIFGDGKKITASNFEEDFYNPATSANATECLAYLLDWKNKNLNGKSAKKKTVSALDKDPYAVGDMKKLWLFEPREDGTLEITCYKGSETVVTVPPRIGKNTVTAIGDMAFSPFRDRRTAAQAKVMRDITEITIPDTVTAIDPAFIAGCTSLEKITVEDGNPAYHANGNCLIHTTSKILVAGCKTSVIPDDGSVTAIGDRAFLQAATLTSLAIPETINRLGLQCFGYTGLTAVQIPKGVTKIPEYCFDHCEALTSIQIPETVTAIDRCAIYACKMLKELNVPASVTSIGDFNFTKAVLHVAARSCAEQYAQENNKRYVVE